MHLVIDCGIDASHLQPVNSGGACKSAAVCGPFSHHVLSLEQAKQAAPNPRAIIFTLGTMDAASPYVPWLRELSCGSGEEKTPRVILWGGLADRHGSLSFLKNNLFTFWARSWQELLIYRAMVGDFTKGRLAGDPMAYYTQPRVLERFGVSLDDALKYRKTHEDELTPVAIPSKYGFLHGDANFWNELTCRTKHVLLVDTVADVDVLVHVRHARFMAQPWDLVDFMIRHASCVTSRRLHAALLSALVKIATSVYDTHERANKFFYVGQSACGLNQPLFTVNTAPAAALESAILTYQQLTADSMAEIVSYVR
jgi:hypothetical protein